MKTTAHMQKVLDATAGMSADELEKLAELFADKANKTRGRIHGNRAFTFVRTFLDCGFGHHLFLQAELPTNAEARQMRPEIAALTADGHPRSGPAYLDAVVHNHAGTPEAWITDRDGKNPWPHSYDSDKRMWRALPD